MERPRPSLAAIQRFLDGGGRDHDVAERLAAGERRAVVTRYHAEPSWARPLARREHRRAVEVALERTAAKPESVALEIVPLWTGDNEDAEPGPHWYATHAVLLDGALAAPWEISPVYEDAEHPFERRLSVDVDRWKVASVVGVESYGRSIDLPFRGRTYGVIEGDVFVVRSVSPRSGAPRPRPERDVPMFCQWFEFRVDGVEPELQAQLKARWITTGEDGEILDPA